MTINDGAGTERTVAIVSQVQVGDEFKETEEGGAVFRSEGLAEFFVGGAALLDQFFTIPMAFRGQLDKKRAAGAGLALGDKTFLKQRLDGTVNDRAIEPQLPGDLILVERPAAKFGKDEAARRGAFCPAFQFLHNRKVSRSNVSKQRISKDVFRDELSVIGV